VNPPVGGGTEPAQSGFAGRLHIWLTMIVFTWAIHSPKAARMNTGHPSSTVRAGLAQPQAQPQASPQTPPQASGALKPAVSPAALSGATAAFGHDPVITDWQMTVLRRAANPPLRFRGRRLSCHWHHRPGNATLAISLWQKHAGGFVVAFSRPDPDGPVEDAAPAPSIPDAADLIEAQAKRSVTPPQTLPQTPHRKTAPPHGTTPQSLIALLIKMQNHATNARVFQQITGEALSYWDEKFIQNNQEQKR
jgi:hypothetical protein